jgi:hypothetical protein
VPAGRTALVWVKTDQKKLNRNKDEVCQFRIKQTGLTVNPLSYLQETQTFFMKPARLLALVLALFFFVAVRGQDAPPAATILSARSLAFDEEKKTLTLVNSVSIKTERLFVKDAKMFRIDQRLQTITVFGEAVYEFNGQLIVLPSDGSKERRLEYRIGELVAYLR